MCDVVTKLQSEDGGVKCTENRMLGAAGFATESHTPAKTKYKFVETDIGEGHVGSKATSFIHELQPSSHEIRLQSLSYRRTR